MVKMIMEVFEARVWYIIKAIDVHMNLNNHSLIETRLEKKERNL